MDWDLAQAILAVIGLYVMLFAFEPQLLKPFLKGEFDGNPKEREKDANSEG